MDVTRSSPQSGQSQQKPGDGFDRTRNWTRYDQGEDRIIFEEGVDGYVAFAGSLYNNVARTMTQLKNG